MGKEKKEKKQKEEKAVVTVGDVQVREWQQ